MEFFESAPGKLPPNSTVCVLQRAITLFVGIVVLFYKRDGTEDDIGDGLAVRGLDGGAHGGALPLGADANGPGRRGLGPGGYDLLDDGLVGTEFGDHGDNSTFGGGGDAAIGGVVAKPNDVGDVGVVIGKVEGGDVAGDAVDHEPGGGLPGPAGGFGGEGIIDVEGASDHEGPVGDIVHFADGPLLLNAVDVEGSDVKGGGFFGFIVRVGFGRGVGDAPRWAERNAVDFWSFGKGGDREVEEQEH